MNLNVDEILKTMVRVTSEIDNHEVLAEVEFYTNGINDAVIAFETLSVVKDMLGVNSSKQAVVMSQIVLESTMERLSLPLVNRYSLEDYTESSNIAIETLGETLVSIWEAIVKTFKTIIKKLKNLFKADVKQASVLVIETKKLEKAIETMVENKETIVKASVEPAVIEDPTLGRLFSKHGYDIGTMEMLFNDIKKTSENMRAMNLLVIEEVNLANMMTSKSLELKALFERSVISKLGVSKEAIHSEGGKVYVPMEDAEKGILIDSMFVYIRDNVYRLISENFEKLSGIDKDVLKAEGIDINDVDFDNSYMLSGFIRNGTILAVDLKELAFPTMKVVYNEVTDPKKYTKYKYPTLEEITQYAKLAVSYVEDYHVYVKDLERNMNTLTTASEETVRILTETTNNYNAQGGVLDVTQQRTIYKDLRYFQKLSLDMAIIVKYNNDISEQFRLQGMAFDRLIKVSADYYNS